MEIVIPMCRVEAAASWCNAQGYELPPSLSNTSVDSSFDPTCALNDASALSLNVFVAILQREWSHRNATVKVPSILFLTTIP